MITLEEALGITNCTITPEPKTSKNIKFNASELLDIEQIKLLLKQGLTQRAIAQKIGHPEEVVSRKISKWMQTPDFDEWLDGWWLDLGMELNQEPELKAEVYRQVTRLKIAKTTRRTELKAEIKEKVMVASIDLSKLSEDDRRAILAAEEAYTRAETSIRPE